MFAFRRQKINKQFSCFELFEQIRRVTSQRLAILAITATKNPWETTAEKMNFREYPLRKPPKTDSADSQTSESEGLNYFKEYEYGTLTSPQAGTPEQ